jgi:hypothetical protein
VKRRDPDALIRVALNDVRCPRYNGHGRTRIVGLSGPMGSQAEGERKKSL